MLALALATSAPQPLLTIRSYDAATVSFIARATANGGRALSVSEKTAFDDFVLWCKAYGIWAVRDAMFPLALIDDATSRTNLVSGTWTLAKSGAPVFTAGKGWAGLLAAGGFLQSNFTPSTAGGNYTLNNAGVDILVETATANANIGGGNNGRFQASSSGFFGGRINDGTTNSGAACGDVQDLLGWDRTASNVLKRTNRGVKYSTDTSVSTSLDASPWTFCGNDGIAAYSDARLGFVGWGASLTDVQRLALRQGVKALYQALGATVTFARTFGDGVNVGTRPGAGTYFTQNAGQAWSYSQDGNYERFEIRAGDLWNGTCRSEVVLSGINFVNGVDMAFSDTIRWGGVQSGAWHVHGQLHGPDTGPTAGYSPGIGLDLDNQGVLQLETNYDIGAGQVYAPYATGQTLTAGQKYNRVVRFTMNPAAPGTSTATVYINGTAVLTKTGVNIGFSNDGGTGSYFKDGVYRDSAGNTTEFVEVWNREIDTWANLQSRVASPLPTF